MEDKTKPARSENVYEAAIFAQQRLIAAEPNLVATVGVDRGSGFEQLEEASDV